MDIVLSSTFADDHAIKISALYCNKIFIPDCGFAYCTPHEPIPEGATSGSGIVTVTSVYRSASDDLKDHLKPLVDGEIVVFSKDESFNSDLQYDFEEVFDNVMSSIPEDESIKAGIVYRKSLCDGPDLSSYSAFLAASAYWASKALNRPILTDSMITNTLLLYAAKENRLKTQENPAKLKANYLIQEVLREFLPDINDASFEDVLEIRFRFRGELEAFRNKMSILSDKIRANPWEPDLKHEIERIVEVEIKPETASLKTALRHSNLKLVNKVFNNLTDARTYVPFIGTVLGHVEPSIAALATGGIAGSQALFGSLIEQREIRDKSGLVFLLKGPRKLPNKRQLRWNMKSRLQRLL